VIAIVAERFELQRTETCQRLRGRCHYGSSI
jgi:hypothetical protein